MKVLQIRLILDDGSIVPMDIPEDCDVSIFQNSEKRSFSGITEYFMPKQYSTILIAPKGTNTERISKAIDEVL